MYTVFGFYKFKKIKFLKKYKALFQKEIFKNNVRGTIILSAEGINGTIAGKKDESKIIESLLEQFKSNLDFKLDVNENLARSMAKSAAIKRGQILEISEMQALIDKLFAFFG